MRTCVDHAVRCACGVVTRPRVAETHRPCLTQKKKPVSCSTRSLTRSFYFLASTREAEEANQSASRQTCNQRASSPHMLEATLESQVYRRLPLLVLLQYYILLLCAVRRLDNVMILFLPHAICSFDRDDSGSPGAYLQIPETWAFPAFLSSPRHPQRQDYVLPGRVYQAYSNITRCSNRYIFHI